MAVIYFLRHGQTEWNAERRVQGHLDAQLNDTGREQAARNGRALRTVLADPQSFDYVSSPLSRATETMAIARGELGLPPNGFRTDERLREIHMGDWQGHTFPDIERDWPDQVAARNDDPWTYRYPGDGESWSSFTERALSWLTEVDRDTVVTAHGGIMRCLRGHFMGLATKETVQLDVPQDKVLRIEDGALSWL